LNEQADKLSGPDSSYSHSAGMIEIAIADMWKQLPQLPEHKVHADYPGLGKNYYCECGVLFSYWSEKSPNFCGNCGQRLREVIQSVKKNTV
jgi:hypothetical protein